MYVFDQIFNFFTENIPINFDNWADFNDFVIKCRKIGLDDDDDFDIYPQHYPVTSNEYNTILKLCSKFNIPHIIDQDPKSNKIWDNKKNISKYDENRTYIYNGKHLEISKSSSFHELCYEIGRYLVASPGSRLMVNYGMTKSIDIFPKMGYYIVCENIISAILGVFIEFSLGKDIIMSYKNIGWDDDEIIDDDKFWHDLFQYYVNKNILHPETTLH